MESPTLEQRVKNAIELSNAVGNLPSVEAAERAFTKEELISMLVMVRSVLEGTAIYIAKDNSFRHFE